MRRRKKSEKGDDGFSLVQTQFGNVLSEIKKEYDVEVKSCKDIQNYGACGLEGLPEDACVEACKGGKFFNITLKKNFKLEEGTYFFLPKSKIWKTGQVENR